MSKVTVTPGIGASIATTQVSRDGGTEDIQLVALADAVSAKMASVTDPGTSGTEAVAVQGVTGGIPQNVSMRGATLVGAAPTNANTQIATGAGRFYGMTCTSPTSGSAFATAHDNAATDASGNVLGRAGNGKDDSNTPGNGVRFTNGLVIATPANGPAVTVYYSAEPT